MANSDQNVNDKIFKHSDGIEKIPESHYRDLSGDFSSSSVANPPQIVNGKRLKVANAPEILEGQRIPNKAHAARHEAN